ncbi:MAG: hypothetical protein QOG49_1829 [Frankiaceae bacterium]|nr:hypothetical protein [Frankiaceae bacterium]
MTQVRMPAAERVPVQVRRARLATSVVFAIHGTVTGSFASRIPWIRDHVHVGVGGLGIALIAIGVGAMLSMPFSGRLVHRYSPRILVRALIIAWCLALLLPALPSTLWLLAVVMIGYGAAAGLADVAMNAHAVLVEERYGRSVMSGFHGFWSLGGLIGSGLGALAAHADIDARAHFLAVFVVLSVVSVVVCRWLLADVPDVDADEPPAFALPSRPVLLIGLIGLCAVFAEGASLDWAAVYVRDELHGTAAIAALGVSALSFTMTGTRLAGDKFVERVGAVAAVRVGAVISTLGTLAVVLAPNPAVAILGFGIIGAGVAVVEPLVFAAAGRVGPHPGRSIAGAAGVAYGAGLVAPGVIGGIAKLSSLTVSFILVAVLTALMGLGAGVLRPAESQTGG